MICKKLILTYIPQEKFPHPKNKPDNTVEISNQLIIFDEEMMEEVEWVLSRLLPKKDMVKSIEDSSTDKGIKFTVTLKSKDIIHLYKISQFRFQENQGWEYYFNISLKKIQDFQLIEKLSPEERDNVCRIIGKFAHTTKRRIQIDQYFAEEFLDTLKKAGSQLPKEVLKQVIEFEGAEKLNPPMEKRNKKILTQELIDKKIDISKEIEIRNIPQIDAKISFKKDTKNG